MVDMKEEGSKENRELIEAIARAETQELKATYGAHMLISPVKNTQEHDGRAPDIDRNRNILGNVVPPNQPNFG